MTIEERTRNYLNSKISSDLNPADYCFCNATSIKPLTLPISSKLLYLAGFVAVFGFMGFMATKAAITWANMPTVYFSYKTKQCVDVQDWNDNPKDVRPAYSCHNMPKKFNHEWVE